VIAGAFLIKNLSLYAYVALSTEGYRFLFRYYIAYCIPMTESKGAPGKIIFLGACLIAAAAGPRGQMGQFTARRGRFPQGERRLGKTHHGAGRDREPVRIADIARNRMVSTTRSGKGGPRA